MIVRARSAVRAWVGLAGAGLVACAAPEAASPPTPPTAGAPAPAEPLVRAREVEAAPSRPSDAALFNSSLARAEPAAVAAPPPPRGRTRRGAREVAATAGPAIEAIQRVLHDNRHGLDGCVTDSWRAGERLRGTMEVELVIEHHGRVVAARVLSGRFRGSTLAGCVVSRARGWRFPPWRRRTRAVFVLPYLVEPPR